MAQNLQRIPKAVCLYRGSEQENFHIDELADYLSRWLEPERIQIRSEFVRHHLRTEGALGESAVQTLAADLASAQIEDPARRLEDSHLPPDPEHFAQQRDWLFNVSATSEIFYDGLRLQRAYLNLICPQECSADYLHIAFTNKLLGTWDPSDRRYHARVGIYAMPCLISTIGVVEAPAKPREYYFGLMAGVDEEQLKSAMESRFIDHGDERLSELLKGYLMQAVFYHLLAEPFCQDPHCRLFNAHWQEEMIAAQLSPGPEFCDRHRQLLRELSSNTNAS